MHLGQSNNCRENEYYEKNYFGMQNKVINNNNFGHVTDYTHV